jgi:iron complex transport system substrate-binding protein
VRVVSHTCSNTEIVCALDCADLLVGVDDDSDFPAARVAPLPKLGRDLQLDVARVRALKPDLVLTSLTVPGHEKIVDELHRAGLSTLVCDPQSLQDVYGDIARIAAALGVAARGAQLIEQMRAAMPAIPHRADAPRILIEWWPKPVIVPAQRSWATDVVQLAGGVNPWGGVDAKSTVLDDEQVLAAAPDAIVMSWCGVREENYRVDVVRRRAGWQNVPAVRDRRIVPITEAWLGRPGPRLVEGYRALAGIIAAFEPGGSDGP